jgi:uncharacterized protein (TIGR00369 family)
MTFALLPRRDTTPSLEEIPVDGVRTSFRSEEYKLSGPITTAAGIRDGDGTARLDIAPYVQNSLGAVQGGMMALLGETAGSAAVAEVIGADVTSVDLHVTYLALGRAGPIRARAEVLAADSTRGCATVHLFEDDGDGRLTTVVDLAAVRLPPTARS